MTDCRTVIRWVCPLGPRGNVLGGREQGITNGTNCDVCPRHARYGFATTDGTRQMRCTRHAVVYPRVRDRAVRVALVVGTILFLINQLDVVLSGNLTLLVVMKIALTSSSRTPCRRIRHSR